MRGPELLSSWMESDNRSANQVAIAVQTTHQSVMRWIRREATPGHRFRLRLDDVSGGHVPADSWSDESREVPWPNEPFPMEQQEIAYVLNLSPQRVDAIEKTALRKLASNSKSRAQLKGLL